tara:strand:- start:457 stop:1119 length:663 start_codon:yes stop_codon:yes gene_type:complete
MTDTQRSTKPLDCLLDAMLTHAAFDGWNTHSLSLAAKDCGLSDGEVALAAPRGVLDLIAHWSARSDAEARTAIEAADLKSMKIRERVTFAVQTRLDTIGHDDEAARKARARLLLPDAGTMGAELIWATSDMIWRALGDPSTDVNFYTKRLTLSAVYGSSLAAWLGDQSIDKAEAKAFLDRRIENVMQFEKFKAQTRKLTSGLPDPAEMLAKLRYGFDRRA